MYFSENTFSVSEIVSNVSCRTLKYVDFSADGTLLKDLFEILDSFS